MFERILELIDRRDQDLYLKNVVQQVSAESDFKKRDVQLCARTENEL